MKITQTLDALDKSLIHIASPHETCSCCNLHRVTLAVLLFDSIFKFKHHSLFVFVRIKLLCLRHIHPVTSADELPEKDTQGVGKLGTSIFVKKNSKLIYFDRSTLVSFDL